MLFIAQIKGTRNCTASSNSNDIWPRALAYYQLSKLLGNEEKKTEMKTMMEQGSRPELASGVFKLSTIIIAIPQGGFRTLIELFGSAACRRQMPLMLNSWK